MKKIGFLIIISFFINDLIAQKIPDTNSLYPILENGKWGLMQKNGDVYLTPKYEFTGYYHDGMCLIKQAGLYGFIDALGREIIKPQFTMAHDFSEGYALVMNPFMEGLNQYEFINTKGEVTPNGLGILVSASDFHNSRALVKPLGSGNILVIDKSFKVAFENPNCIMFDDSTQNFHEGLLKAICNTHIGYLDTMGRVYLNPMVDDGGIFSEGLSSYSKTDLIGYMNKNGESVINTKWDLGFPFSEGMARVAVQTFVDPETFQKTGGIFGFIDKTGTEIILPQYEEAGDFHNGLAKVKINGKFGFIDKTGKQVIQPTYDNAQDFYHGLAFVKSGNLWMYIDAKGKTVWHSSN